MTCREIEELLHAYCDGELDLIRHVRVEEHLPQCARCAKQEEQLRLLRSAVSAAAPYHRAPASLRAKIQAALASEPARPQRRRDAKKAAIEREEQSILAAPPIDDGRRRRALHVAAIAAGILLLIGASLQFGPMLFHAGPSADDRLAEWVVASHVRSLQVEHLTDVISTDRHTVKPWFRGKLDFSPQVADLSKEGYPLAGGRLDYLADRPVAALVYARHAHVINVFIWRAPDDAETAVRSFSHQGFHIRAWQGGGMTCWAISDLNDQELDEFARAISGFHAADT